MKQLHGCAWAACSDHPANFSQALTFLFATFLSLCWRTMLNIAKNVRVHDFLARIVSCNRRLRKKKRYFDIPTFRFCPLILPRRPNLLPRCRHGKMLRKWSQSQQKRYESVDDPHRCAKRVPKMRAPDRWLHALQFQHPGRCENCWTCILWIQRHRVNACTWWRDGGVLQR